MGSAATFRLRRAFFVYARVALAGACLIGVSRLLAAETAYSAGMSSLSIQSSLDGLTAAGLTYPHEYRFRTAQAKQLFALAHRFPELTAPAEQSLSNALQADPYSLELASALYAARIALRDCAGAAAVAVRVAELAPRRFVPQECA